MAKRHNDENENENAQPTSILKRSRSTFKAPGLIPVGVWTLRCTGATYKTMMVERDGDEREIDVITLVHEPLVAGSSVDPDEASAIDMHSGKSPFDGKRLFTKFFIYSEADLANVNNVIGAHLGDADEDTEFADDLKAMKGKTAKGEVYVRTWKDKTSGEDRSDNSVRAWAAAD